MACRTESSRTASRRGQLETALHGRGVGRGRNALQRRSNPQCASRNGLVHSTASNHCPVRRLALEECLYHAGSRPDGLDLEGVEPELDGVLKDIVSLVPTQSSKDRQFMYSKNQAPDKRSVQSQSIKKRAVEEQTLKDLIQILSYKIIKGNS